MHFKLFQNTAAQEVVKNFPYREVLKCYVYFLSPLARKYFVEILLKFTIYFQKPDFKMIYLLKDTRKCIRIRQRRNLKNINLKIICIYMRIFQRFSIACNPVFRSVIIIWALPYFIPTSAAILETVKRW